MGKQLNYVISGHLHLKIEYTSSGARLFAVMNALLSLVKKRKINGYCYSTTKTKNRKEKHSCTEDKEICIMIWAAIQGDSHKKNLPDEQA